MLSLRLPYVLYRCLHHTYSPASRGLIVRHFSGKSSTTDYVSSGGKMRVERSVLTTFAAALLQASGAHAEHAALMAHILVMSDARGIPSHGVNRLEMYCRELKEGVVDGHGQPVVLSETAAVAAVDGANALGGVVGDYCMRLAIDKAKTAGIGWVTARNSNHYGIAGYYAMLAAEAGMVGMSMTNTSPIMFPTRSAKAAVGTNPIAVACPVHRGPDFVFDMATSAVPVGKVEVCHRQQKDLPPGWGLDSSGRPTTDPAAVLDGGGLLPLGGEEVTAGYKGYGLAMVVDMLCGVLGGARSGTDIGPWRAGRTEPANLGQCFMAIDSQYFPEGFAERMQTFSSQMRSLPLAEGETEVLVPGDVERRNEEESAAMGVGLHPNIFRALQDLAAQLNMPLLPERPKSDA